MSKLFAVLVVLLVVLGGVSMVAAQGATDLTFWTFVDAHAAYWQSAADAWNAENPDRQINLMPTVTPWAAMHDNLLLALQSGSGAPDMVDVELTRFPTFLRGDIHFLDITDLVNEYQDNLVASRLIYQWQGVQYAVDYHIGTVLMFYNKEVMDAAGVDIDSIKTWDDYIAAGQQVTQGDVWMTALETNGCQQGHTLMLMNGGGTYDVDGNLIIDSPQNAEALQFMADLKLKYGIAEDAPGGGVQQPDTYTALTDGKIASIFMPEWYLQRFRDLLPDLSGKIYVRPMPVWEGKSGTFASTMSGGTGTAITDQIDPAKVQLAKDFLVYAKMTHQAGVNIWQQLGFDPIIKDVYDDPVVTESLPYFGNENVFDVFKGMQGNLAPEYLGPDYADIWNIMSSNVCYNILDNGAAPADELAALKSQIESMQ